MARRRPCNSGSGEPKTTAAMILNLTKLSKAYVRQITKDDSTKSALSCLALNQAVLFNLLTADDFNVDGTLNLNAFMTKLIKSRDPMWSTNMV